MKLNEYMKQVNKSLETLKDLKFKSYDELNNNIIASVSKIDTELGNLLRIESDNIRLITREDLHTWGSVGHELLQLKMNLKKDKRIKYGDIKGSVINITVVPAENITEDILNLELKDLQQYFDVLEKGNAIQWYNEEIENLKKKIREYENKRDALLKA